MSPLSTDTVITQSKAPAETKRMYSCRYRDLPKRIKRGSFPTKPASLIVTAVIGGQQMT
jgi:hypothetical protein